MRRLACLAVLLALACGGSPTDSGDDLSGMWSYTATVSNEDDTCEATGYTLRIENSEATLSGGTVTCNDLDCGDAFAGSGALSTEGGVSFATDKLDHDGSFDGSSLSGTVTLDRLERQCAANSVTVVTDATGLWSAER